MKRFLVLSLATVMTFNSCVSKGGDVARLVPQDAYAAVLAESPLDLFRSADSFFRASGLDRLADGKSLQETLREYSEKNEEMKGVAKTLDFGKPYALTIVPERSGETPRAVAVLWLPLKDGQAAYTQLMGSLDDFEGTVTFVSGYAALCFNGPAPVALPSRRADLSRLSGYPKDSVKAWVNARSLREDFGLNWADAFKQAFDRPSAKEEDAEESQDPNAPYDYNERNFDWEEYYGDSGSSSLLSAGLTDGASSLKSLLDKAAENVDTLDFALGVNEKGAYVRAGASVPEDRALGKLAASQGPAKGLPYLKYLEADALIGGAASLDLGALASFMKLYLNALGMEEYFGQKYFELLESSYAAMGPDSAFSFDASLDPGFGEKAGRAQTPEEIADLIRNSFSIELSGTQDLRDKELYRKSLKLLEDKEVFGETFNTLLQSMGMELVIKVEEGSAENTAYDAIRITLGGSAVSGSPQSKALLDALMEKLTIYTSCQKDKAYTVMGDPGLLAETIRRDGAALPILSDAGYKDFAATTPKDTRGIYYISMRRLFEIIAAVAPNAIPGSPEDLDKLYGYYAMGKGSLETGIFLGARDIKAILSLIPGSRFTEDEAL